MTMIRFFFVVLPPGRVPKTQTQMNIASGPHPYILQQTASSDEFSEIRYTILPRGGSGHGC